MTWSRMNKALGIRMLKKILSVKGRYCSLFKSQLFETVYVGGEWGIDLSTRR